MSFDTLPKVELHCHLDGIMDPPMLREIERRGVQLPVSSETLEAAYPIQSCEGFFNWGRAIRPLEGELERLKPFLAVHLERLKSQEVVYTEIMIASSEIPRDRQELVGKVQEFRTWVDQQEDGVIQVEFLACFNRNRTPEFVEELADRVLMLYEAGLFVGAALAGPERDHPVKPFRKTFARLREAGLGIEIHAGEWCGPESVWDALEHGLPDRIGHGVALFEDPRLVRRFQEQQIHIEICPTSNVRTSSVRCIEDHPVRLAKDLGLNFGINTDDPGAFQCSMTSEYQLLAETFGFDGGDFEKIRGNSLKARFQPALRFLDHPAGSAGMLLASHRSSDGAK
jgi:adenosine deaminase